VQSQLIQQKSLGFFRGVQDMLPLSVAVILLANKVPDLSTLHLEFSIVVVFLVMAVMLIQNKAAIYGVVSSSIMVLILSWLELGSAILLAGFSGMWVAALFDRAED
jgi:predicted branched-subunit amino acid permease